MRLPKSFSFFIIFILFTSFVYAQEGHQSGYLTVDEIQRLKVVKELLDGVDTQSLQDTIRALEKTRRPLINIEMKEAMAKTYMDIVREINVQGQDKKKWLYSMVCLNMAYLQFGGSEGKYGSTTELNRLIRKKLIGYLPSSLLKQFGSMYSLQ